MKSKKDMKFPYRLCLAGGWIDQPWVSEIHPGSVVVAQIWPTLEFNDRSGLATSSRKIAITDMGRQVSWRGSWTKCQTWYVRSRKSHPGKNIFPVHRIISDYYTRSKPPTVITVATGLTRLNLTPAKISVEWLSDVLHLVPLEPRPDGYDPLKEIHLEKKFIREPWRGRW